MHALLYALSGLGMIALPLLVAGLVVRRLRVGWGLIGAGALVFVLSQLVHIPLNLGVGELFQRALLPTPPAAVTAVLLPVALGLSAGLCEEGARWLALRSWQQKARGWAAGVGFGLGHGGGEALILGALVLVTLRSMLQVRGMDLATLGIPAEHLDLARQQIAAFWEAPLWMVPLGLVERCLTVPVHVGLSLLVMRTVEGAGARWWLLAVGLHAALDAGAVAIVPHGALWAELYLSLYTSAALWFIWSSRPAHDSAAPPPPPPLLVPAQLDLRASSRKLGAP